METKNSQIKPGFYWYWQRGLKQWTVAEVFSNFGIPSFQPHGEERDYPVDERDIFVPITPPAKPKKAVK